MIGVQLMQVNIKNLIAEAQCYDSVRELRWPEGRQCPFCDAKRVIKRGLMRTNLPVSVMSVTFSENALMT